MARAAVLLAGLLAGLCTLAAGAHAQEGARNLTTGGPLRAGFYGRIDPGEAEPPPVIYARPVQADGNWVPPGAKPVYLYVPPGQVRKWKQHCARWKACDQPVLFVRVDDSPSRLGSWKQRPSPAQAAGAPTWLSWLLPARPAAGS